MASYQELKSRYHTLHRLMCGIAVTCVMIAIVGSAIYGGADWTTSWTDCRLRVGRINFAVCYDVGALTVLTLWTAGIVTAVIAVEYCILKVWAAFEEVHHGSTRSKKRKR